jgi:hypothetical protein
MVREDVTYCLETPRKQHIIAVQPPHDFAVRLGETLVDCVVVSSVRLGGKKMKSIAIPFDNAHTAIIGSTIDNSILKTWVVLIQHTFQG